MASSTGSISGLISGLDTDSIIEKMLEYGKKPIAILQNEQTTYTTELSAWQDINTRLLALKMKAGTLANSYNFLDKTATASDTTALDVISSADAATGTYNVTINRLATAEQRQSQGYGDIDTTTIGTGSITVGIGSNTKDITIDSTNNTLSGLRDAINRAGVGITATISDLGSLDTHDYHLVLTSSTTGQANSIVWNPTLSGGTAPTWTINTSAQDSMITVGPDGNTTTITKSTNSISDVYPGMTLNLKAADTVKKITVTVSPNTDTIKENVQNFVDQYNQVIDNINKQFSYDPDTQTSGTLFGDYTLQTVQQDLREKVLGTISGLPSTMSTLSQIGITSDTTDHLVLDGTALDKALSSNPDGVMKLFAKSAETSDYSIAYDSSSSSTIETGSGPGYTVRVDRVATQARVTAGVAQDSNLTSDETLTINGTAISLKAGMTGQQVVDEINNYTSTTGITASRTQIDGTGIGNYLTLKRTAYGAGYNISAISTVNNENSGTLATDSSGIGTQEVTDMGFLGEAGTGTGGSGQDVAGAFGVTTNGVTTWETATGMGQTLTANSTNTNTSGLSVIVKSQTTGEHGTVTITRGIGDTLNNMLDFITGKDGSVTTAQDTINQKISDLKDEITTKTSWLSDYEEQLRNKFTLLESTLANMKDQGDYLSAQFTAMNKSTK